MRTTHERARRIREKAERELLRRKKRNKILFASLGGAALALILAVNLVLFLPYSVGGVDLSAYRYSEYYPLMREIERLAYPKSTTNNSHQWFSQNPEPSAPSQNPNSDSSGMAEKPIYREVTNNQSEDVVEGDLFKRSDTHIFYLSYTASDWQNTGEITIRLGLSAYSIAGEDSQKVGELSLYLDKSVCYYFECEMYLSEDAKTATILFTYADPSFRYFTQIVRADVSDPPKMKEIDRTMLSGKLLSSRMTDGSLLLITRFEAYRPDFSKPEEFLPCIGTPEHMSPLAMDSIELPKNPTNAFYTLFFSLSEKIDAFALFGYSSDAIYVSPEHIFTARPCDSAFERSEVMYLSYTEGFAVEGSFQVNGTPLDPYSYDEKNGVLRLFTVGERSASYRATSDLSDPPQPPPLPVCNLYCVRLSDFSVIESIQDFAPENETIRTVRFSGDRAYVSTSELSSSSDSTVFEFFFSNGSAVTYRRAGAWKGFALELVPFYDDLLLGIGEGEAPGSFRLGIYRLTDTAVEKVASFEQEDTDFLNSYKDFFLDSEHGLVGLALYKNDYINYRHSNAFFLFRFDGETLETALKADGYFYGARAFLADGYFYLLDGWNFTVEKIF